MFFLFKEGLTPMSLFFTYVSMLIFFLLVDAVMLMKFMVPLFQANVSELMRDNVNFLAATIFYLFYVFGIYWFGTQTGIKTNSLLMGVFSGFLLGLLAYGTYEVTSFSLMKGWTLKMVVIDTLWGGILTGSTAGVGVLMNRMLSN